ncbi:hypothetical protein [Clavibacter sp.]|uniref:hypothetical protein n=1 Tax=Clavibacter sp. TaxID=1871044 RepID=UPI0019918BB3|nr:hypothetical protein [Clavibacter sp.]MBD5381991.1 hypothetical protein [Clavibacter sp.]
MFKINEYISNRKLEYQKQLEESIRDDFKIEERNGVLYLTHKGTAVVKINPTSQSLDVTNMLNNARDCAVEFAGL